MRRVQDVHNNGNLTHDALGGTAAYEVTKAYEDHLAKNRKLHSRAKAKELYATFVGAAATHLVETKGRDAYDKYKVEHDAKKRLHEHVDKEYQ
ncbi:CipC1 protein [Pisolithus tinctorius]|nr:CipC1 protein [Pisolithus tinctorius]